MTQLLLFIISVFLVPPLAIGFVRKLKARLQNRIGAPIYQPYLDIVRLIKKNETISRDASWVFRAAPAINLSGMLLLSFLIPWLSYKPHVSGDDLFLAVYLLALCRFFSMLAALDAGSVFGGFGASREATLSLLVEPAVVLSLVSLAVSTGSTDLGAIFNYTASPASGSAALWLLAGGGLFLSNIVELSRMPVDDPVTHLELTMVHEAMILENSGRNLAMAEFAHWLKLSVLLGLCGQCFLHAVTAVYMLSSVYLPVLSLLILFVLLTLIAIIESSTVKLRWTKVPDFIAYSVALSFIAMFVAVAGGRS